MGSFPAVDPTGSDRVHVLRNAFSSPACTLELAVVGRSARFGAWHAETEPFPVVGHGETQTAAPGAAAE